MVFVVAVTRFRRPAASGNAFTARCDLDRKGKRKVRFVKLLHAAFCFNGDCVV